MLSEGDAPHKLAGAGRTDGCRVQSSEAGDCQRLRSGDVARRGHGQYGPVEDIEKLHAYLEAQALSVLEALCQVDFLIMQTPPAVVVVIRRRSTPVARARIHPGGRI